MGKKQGWKKTQARSKGWCAGLKRKKFCKLPLPARMSLAWAEIAPMAYDGSAAYPRQRPGLPPELVKPDQYLDPGQGIVCSPAMAYLLPTALPNHAWDADTYAQIVLFKELLPEGKYAPITAVESVGAGRQVDIQVESDLKVGAIYLVQGWRVFDPDAPNPADRYNGHAKAIEVLNEARQLVIYESTDRHSGIGPTNTPASFADIVTEYPAGLAWAELKPSY